MAATTMQLEFEQAMSDFKTMFPDMDVEVIEAILRCNKGAVDATIDQLLAMSTDNQNEKLRNEMDHRGRGIGASAKRENNNSHSNSAHKNSYSCSPINKPHTESERQETLLSISPARSNGGASPKTSAGNSRNGNSSRWKPPMLLPLPRNFLRIGEVPGSSRPGTAGDELPDEQFAMMLQNEEFMNELRWNQEFMLALEKEQQEQKGKGDDEAAFKDRVRNMGKMSRKKFQQLAKKFTFQKNKKIGAVRHPDSLLLQEEHSDDDEPRRLGGAKK